MIPAIFAFGELLGIIVLLVYGLADNERIYASIFAFLSSSLLSFLLGYQMLFGLVKNDTNTVTFTDVSVGYVFIFMGIGIAIMSFAVMIDTVLKGRNK